MYNHSTGLHKRYHPAARVITQRAKEKFGGSLLTNIPTNFHEIAGAGVEGDINGECITVGSQSLFENKKYVNQQQLAIIIAFIILLLLY
jgi:cation transport ATPase